MYQNCPVAEVVSHTANVSLVTRTSFVALEGAAGQSKSEKIMLRTTMARPVAVAPNSAAGASFREVGDGATVEVTGLREGQTFALFSQNDPPSSFSITPAKGCFNDFNH